MQRRRAKPTQSDARDLTLTPAQIRERTFQRAAKLLAARPRSTAELRERLLQGGGVTKAVVETVIARQTEYGYLDDEKFAVSYASSRVRQRPIGRQRLQRDLMFKKVNREVADEALDSVYSKTTEEELIDRALEKRIRTRGRPKTKAE